MADCSASGTVLDRTARAMLSDSAGAKQVASVMGHVLAGSSAAAMNSVARPLAAPEYVVLPDGNVQIRPLLVAGASQQQAQRPPEAAYQPQPFFAQHPASFLQHPPLDNYHYHHPAKQAAEMAQQRQYQYQAQQQQQQMMMLQQQQQQHQQMNYFMMMQRQQQFFQMEQVRLQQQQQQKQQQQQDAATATSTTTTTTATTTIDNWHEGLDLEAKEALRSHLESLNKDAYDDDVATVGHEGLVQGATIEELAAAWAEAQSDYYDTGLNDDVVEETVNLWSGASRGDYYEFINKDAPAPADPNTDWMAEGMREFQAGNLRQAIYLFEMELQHSNQDNATAWRMLGRCHAENDMDQQAIACLEQAVERDPYSPEALLALGVSYVNELNHGRALESLREWITHNPTFAGLELEEEDDVYGAAATTTAAHDTVSAFEDVQRLLLKAMEYAPSEAADVLEALGVIYNVSRDYDAAVDALRRAVDLRPNDYQLWNKLGATLANGSRSEEALPAYHKALQLKPKYARAWLNMAISHSNLQNYDEAARCYLQTLSLNPSATHCWSYLRIALSSSEQWDLIPLVATQDLKAFKEHFDFVIYE